MSEAREPALAPGQSAGGNDRHEPAAGGRSSHWDRVYRCKPADTVSWFRPHLDRSLQLIEGTGAGHDARILDVGGGASTLVDDLLAAGFDAVSVLDVSAEAIAVARRRLGAAADRVRWIQADITCVELPPASVDVWHDRAALHFLTDPGERAAYVRQLGRVLAPGGSAILLAFAPEGPRQCSDLPVCRYNVRALQALLGRAFVLRHGEVDLHVTPSGREQPFTVCWFSYEPERPPERES